VLYLADTAPNRIAAIPDAVHRTTPAIDGGATLTQGGQLSAPLDLVTAPDGDVLTVNAGNGKVVETTPGGKQVASRTLVASGAGGLFGLALAPAAQGIYFVNDSGTGADANSLELLH